MDALVNTTPAARSAGRASARPAAGLALAAAVVLAAAVALTGAGGGLVDAVTADSALGGWGQVAGVVGEALAAVALLVYSRTAAVWPGRTGAVGTGLTVAGLAGMVAGGIATAATGDHEALGLVYVAGALAAFAGAVVLAVAAWRARVLPRPLMVLFALAFVPLLPPVAALCAVAALGWLAGVLRRPA